MKTLAIDCATEACSTALFENGRLVEGRYEVLGRGHAERLVPMISELPDKGRADRILVSLGPGSFTGVRIGVAAARALGLAWGAQVFGYPTLALVAAMARVEIAENGEVPVTVCMSGGHGEWFVQNFAADGLGENAPRSLTPEQTVQERTHGVIAGSKAGALAALLADKAPRVLDLLPDARHAMLLPEVLLGEDLSPVYGRPPDARLPASR